MVIDSVKRVIRILTGHSLPATEPPANRCVACFLPTRYTSVVGEMAEWSIAAVLKTVIPLKRDRGFESHSLLQNVAVL